VAASRIDATLAASWRIPLIVWAVLLLPTLALAFILTRSLTSPIERLRRMTARVASGDLSYRTSIRREDELGDLANSLNSMATQLETRANQLRVEVERSARVLESMGEGVLLIDADGHLLRCNPAAERILGAKLAGMEGQPFVFAARSFPSRALSLKAQEAGKAITEAVELPGGRTLAVEIVPIASLGLDEPQTLFVMRDETSRRALERVRRDFATNVSHELKTPLAGLSLLAETLEHAVREDPEEAAKFVDRLVMEISRLKVLTNDLLTLSRLEDPDATVISDFAAVDIGLLAEDVAEELEPVAAARDHEIVRRIVSEAPTLGDEIALRTMVRNLLDNAIRYTDPGGHIQLEVKEESDSVGAEWIVLSVRDDGMGIPQADQQRIFERFYRVDRARSRETGGTGLGLSIVRHVAVRHGGSVEVESTLGVGSTFTVRLPKA
jgi:two-component system phosphate regulon sensor histidine kinase PhoR